MSAAAAQPALPADQPPRTELSGVIFKSTKYSKSWTRRYITLHIPSRRLMYKEAADKPKAKGVMLMKKIVRSAEKNEALNRTNPDLYSFAVEGVDPEGKELMWLFRCDDEISMDEWYKSIRESIAAHGLMEPVHYGLPSSDPRCDLPLVTVPTEHLFRFSLLDKAIMYYFGTIRLLKPASVDDAAGKGLQFSDHILVLCDKNNYIFNFAADVIRCFPVASLEVIRAGDKCIGLKLQHPQHDVLFRTEQAVQIIDILRRTVNVATGSDIDVDLSEETPEAIAPTMNLKAYDGFQLTVSAPTPKQKLKHALDVYERQTGQKFVYGSAQNPAQVQGKNAHHTADQMDVEDPMCALLMRLQLKQYIVLMQRQHLDLDVLRCMEEADLQSFGITDAEHRHMIITAVRDGADAVVPAGSGAYDDDDDVDGTNARNRAESLPVAPRRAVIILDSDEDDDVPMPALSAKKVQLDDDDDVIVLPKKNVVIDDSDEDLPIKPAGAAAAAAGGIQLDDDI